MFYFSTKCDKIFQKDEKTAKWYIWQTRKKSLTLYNKFFIKLNLSSNQNPYKVFFSLSFFSNFKADLKRMWKATLCDNFWLNKWILKALGKAILK